MEKKLITKNKFFLALFLALALASGGFVGVNSVFSQTCPSDTQVQETQATLVGEVTDHGGDPNLEVWFQWGKSPGFGFETTKQSKSGLGLFCSTITGLESGTTYFYRAMAKNSAGTSMGETKSFTTKSSPVSVDLKVNSSNGPITRTFGDFVTLSWTSQNAISCQASGDWSGSKAISGSQSVQLDTVKTYTFTITCTGSSGQTATDSVQVIVNARPPVVITKPAIVTN